MLVSNGVAVAPVAYADASPSASNFNYYPESAVHLSGMWATYGQIYRGQLWVATLVNKLAYGVARLPLKVYERTALGRTEARDSPYAALIRNPNSRHDPFFFWLWTTSTFEVYGEALWVKIRPYPGAPPTQLWPLHPSNVFTRRDEQGALTYVYHFGSSSTPLLEFPESDVVHFKAYNPDDQIRGMSRLEPLRATLLAEDAARRASAAMWNNGARPSVALSHPGRLSDPAYERLTKSWDRKHSGVDSWAKTAILEEGMTPHVMQLSAEEMQYIESRKINREEACGLYDVPPPVVHILDHATFSNITEQMRSMYRDTMAPRLGLYESVLDVQLRPDFDPQGDLYAEFLIDGVMRGAFEQRTESYQKAIQSGWMTPAEVRDLENLPDGGPDTHRLYVNAATIPLGTAAGANASGEVVEIKPQAIKSAPLTLCSTCGSVAALSVRGLCRACEGKAARMLNSPKEITS